MPVVDCIFTWEGGIFHFIFKGLTAKFSYLCTLPLMLIELIHFGLQHGETLLEKCMRQENFKNQDFHALTEGQRGQVTGCMNNEYVSMLVLKNIFYFVLVFTYSKGGSVRPRCVNIYRASAHKSHVNTLTAGLLA